MEKIKNTVMKGKNISLQQYKFCSIEFKLVRREIGHVYGDYLADIPFAGEVKNEILSEGLAERHHILPASGWISKYQRTR